MPMFKRIFLFLLTNILVIAMISIVTSVLGLGPYMSQFGINYESLAVFCAVWGMGGAFLSLLLSKVMAKWTMGVKIVPPTVQGGAEGELLRVVQRLSQAAGLPKMPEVGIYDSPEVNAFATGPSKGNALVAVSSGLLQRMDRGELEGVLGHELAHVANGDMVTMTLIQGVVNAFTMFFARIVGFALANAMRSDDDRRPNYLIQSLLVWVFDILFGLLGSIVVCWFSRQREFRADRGGAQYAGRDRMIAALQRLQTTHELVDQDHRAIAALKISGGMKGGLLSLLVTHPPLEERIRRLQQGI